ncbi:MAG: hypothetical protein KJZ83_00285 [Burkholderiaceae bacterium]|nr:hypothetical protein [Burkholderiaceae bacterium]
MLSVVGWVLSFLSGGFVNKVLGILTKVMDNQTAREQLRTQITIEAIRAEVAAQQAGRDIVIAEQGRWYTAIIRPLLALPVIIYLWKVIVWDIVLGLGTTDPVRGIVAEWAGVIVTTYVGGRSIEKIASIIATRRK